MRPQPSPTINWSYQWRSGCSPLQAVCFLTNLTAAAAPRSGLGPEHPAAREHPAYSPLSGLHTPVVQTVWFCANDVDRLVDPLSLWISSFLPLIG